MQTINTYCMAHPIAFFVAILFIVIVLAVVFNYWQSIIDDAYEHLDEEERYTDFNEYI
jgi:flagellar biosynthesis protein FliR